MKKTLFHLIHLILSAKCEILLLYLFLPKLIRVPESTPIYRGVFSDQSRHPGITEWDPKGFLMNLDCRGNSHVSTERKMLNIRAVRCFIQGLIENCGLPWWLRCWRICLQCRSPGSDPWVGKIPWRRECHPIPVFLPGESHGQRSLVAYSWWGHKESDTIEQLICTHTLENCSLGGNL